MSKYLPVDMNGINLRKEIRASRRRFPHEVKLGWIIPLEDEADIEDNKYLGYCVAQDEKTITVKLLGKEPQP